MPIAVNCHIVGCVTIADRLRKELLNRSKNESFYRIAKQTGVDRTCILRFVRFERTLTLDTADKLAAYLKLKLVRD